MKVIIMDFGDSEGKCESCGETKSLQPAGPNFELMCEDCAKAMGESRSDSEASESPEEEAAEGDEG